MTTSPCGRFAQLSDRRALGELLDLDEQRFLLAHRAVCELCDAESQVLERLTGALSDPGCLERPAYSLDAAANQPRAEVRWLSSARARKWSLGALSVAAAVGLLLLGAEWRARSLTTTAAAAVPARLAYSAGKVEIRGLKGLAGAELKKSDVLKVENGGACFSITNTIASCLDAHSELELRELSRERSVVAVRHGLVTHRLLPQGTKRRFVVETPEGSVTALGTTFAVEVTGERDVTIRLYEGRLQVEPRTGSAQLLEAPGTLRLGSSVTHQRHDPALRERDLRLLALAPPALSVEASQLVITTIPTEAELMLDGEKLGPTPVSWLSRPGSHQLSVSAPGYREHRETLIVLPGQRLERQLALAKSDLEPTRPTSRDEEVSPEPKSTEVPETPAMLLTRAQGLRANGAYAKSAQLYQKLIRRYPESAEGGAALLSLGELELSVLGTPASALAHFEAYLARGGRLVQEARYGRIRALGRLGQTTLEEAAIRDFVRDYPKSIQSQRLRERLPARP